MTSSLQVGGWAKLSTCDWPSRLVSTVFAQGCPWECLYCHNPDLIDSQKAGEVSWDDVISFMQARTGLLDGIVFSGGEPTRQPALVDAAHQVKSLGFEVGVHTSGVYPSRIHALIKEGVVDWVGLDIKTALHKYQPVVQAVVVPAKIVESLNALQEANVDLEIRTTIHPSYMNAEDIDSIVSLLTEHAVKEWVIQKVRSEGSTREWEWTDTSLVQYCHQAATAAGISLIER